MKKSVILLMLLLLLSGCNDNDTPSEVHSIIQQAESSEEGPIAFENPVHMGGFSFSAHESLLLWEKEDNLLIFKDDENTVTVAVTAIENKSGQPFDLWRAQAVSQELDQEIIEDAYQELSKMESAEINEIPVLTGSYAKDLPDGKRSRIYVIVACTENSMNARKYENGDADDPQTYEAYRSILASLQAE